MPFVEEERHSEDFEQAVMVHLDAAYNLARWLTRNDQAAEDMVQDACLRAFKAFHGFRGGSARAWLLTIVRNTCYTRLSKDKTHAPLVEFDEELGSSDSESLDPALLAARSIDGESLRKALEQLPPEFREAIVLRELEGLSYQEIAAVAGVPIGTVMSRLARARKRLERSLVPPKPEER